MEIMPIAPKCASNTFKGLWAYGPDLITDADIMSITRQRIAYIHPFADDTQEIINNEAAAISKSITYHGCDDFQVEKLITNVEVTKALSFTKADYQEYKHFYGKTLPEKFKKIERELYLSRLGRYINDGFMYKIKCLLHNLKR